MAQITPDIDPLDKNRVLWLVNSYVEIENLPHRLNIEATLKKLGLNPDYYFWIEQRYKHDLANKNNTQTK